MFHTTANQRAVQFTDKELFMKKIYLIFAVLFLSTISLFAEEVIFTNLDGKRFKYSELNYKFVPIEIIKTQFINLNNEKFEFNQQMKCWERLSNSKSINFYCENPEYLSTLLSKLNLVKEDMISIESFGTNYTGKYYYSLPNYNQFGIIFFNKK